MRTIICPICAERRVGVRVCVQCYHRLNAEFGGTGWLTADWFKFLERAQWREEKADLAQEKIAERVGRLVGEPKRKTKYERAVELLQEGRSPAETRATLAGPEPTRGRRNKASALVRRALEHLGETYSLRTEPLID